MLLSGPVVGQVLQHRLTRILGFSEGFERRTAHSDRRPVQIDGTPRGNKAGLSVKAGAGSALITDHEREPAAYRAPNLEVLRRTDDAAELHDAPKAHMRGYRFADREKCSAIDVTTVFPKPGVNRRLGGAREKILNN
ncbi:hypothetical protein ACWKUA_18770 [Bradyrhizobium sp. LeoA1S1]|uniref:hypothetical protein n=1 Tax=Bradyrhizobium elkanii TaxID=29448 RepID=UPI0012BD41BB